VASSRSDYAAAFQKAVLLSVAFDVVALIAALADVAAGRAADARHHRRTARQRPA
jgi:hypothetical protein